jgi:hypothetical protein
VSRSWVHDDALLVTRLVRVARDVGVVEHALPPLRDLICVEAVDRRMRDTCCHIRTRSRRNEGEELPQPPHSGRHTQAAASRSPALRDVVRSDPVRGLAQETMRIPPAAVILRAPT